MRTTRSAADVIAHRYRLERSLGEGGFGAVYLATDLQRHIQVALKMLHPRVLGEGNVERRFAREAELAKQLDHPHIVRLLDFGSDEDTPFIVYELLRGAALNEVARRGPMAAARVAHIACQVLRALLEAHRHGIVHRDIKPANLFLCEFAGSPDFVKVLDFGIARVDDHSSATKLTETGDAIGTPSYMAREQVRGEAVGPATDLYALGLVLAELLAGRRIMVGTSAPLIAFEQAADRPVPLPPEVLTSPLGAALQRATQKDLGRRYGSAQQMLSDIEAIGPQRLLTVAANGPSSHAAHALPASDTAPTRVPTASTAVAHPTSGMTKLGGAERAPPSRLLRLAIVAIAGLLVVVGALVATLMLQQPSAQPSAQPTREAGINRSLFDNPKDARQLIEQHLPKRHHLFFVTIGERSLRFSAFAPNSREASSFTLTAAGLKSVTIKLDAVPQTFGIAEIPFDQLAQLRAVAHNDTGGRGRVLVIHFAPHLAKHDELRVSVDLELDGGVARMPMARANGRWEPLGLVHLGQQL